MPIQASIAIIALATGFLGSAAAAQVVKGTLIEPSDALRPSSISFSYLLTTCAVRIDAAMRSDMSGLQGLRVEICSSTLMLDPSCLTKIVEPHLGTFMFRAN